MFMGMVVQTLIHLPETHITVLLIFCDVGRGDEVENVEQKVHNIFIKQFMNILGKNNSKFTKQKLKMME